MDQPDKKSEKKTFSHDIDPAMVAEFDRVASTLPGKKFEVLEAMIRGFKALPNNIKLKLMSVQPEDRDPVLALLATLEAPQAQVKRGQKAKVSKVG